MTRLSPPLLLLVGIVAPYACGGTAIVDPPDDDGSGGSGATTTTSSGPTTSSGMGGAPSTTSTTSTSVGPSTSSGMTMCIGCGDYVGGNGDLEELCGFVDVDPQGMVVCQPGTSCQLLDDLQDCTCSECGGDCFEACNGGELTADCLGCITNDCNSELNACTGDVQ